MEAALDEVIVRTDDFRTEERWPQYSPAVVELGVLSGLSFKLYTANQTAGALNLFATYSPFGPTLLTGKPKQSARCSPRMPLQALVGPRRSLRPRGRTGHQEIRYRPKPSAPHGQLSARGQLSRRVRVHQKLLR